MDGLADETWRGIATHLGLHALTLRRTCATFQQRVLALEEIPVVVQLARRLLQLLETLHQLDDEMDTDTKREYYSLWSALKRASYQELFGMIDTLSCTDNTHATKRPCWQLITQFKAKTNIWQVFDHKAKLITQLRPVWNDDTLSNEELVYVMKRFHNLASFCPITFFADDTGCYTTTWHLAASRGNLEVLQFLYRYCNQPIHSTTMPGNNALAHARAGLALARDGWDANPKYILDEQRYFATIAFLQQCDLEDHPWRFLEVDSSSDDDDEAIDMLGEALDAQLSVDW